MEPTRDDMDDIYLPDGRLNPEYTRGGPPSEEEMEALAKRRPVSREE
jgi:hypothetical protein